jgi:hypothetical protein
MQVKAHFIKSCIFDKTIKTIQIDKGTVDFYMRLTSFHSQFRNVGVNYNQIVKLLVQEFFQKKAAASSLNWKNRRLKWRCYVKNHSITEEFEAKYLKKF